MKLFLKKNKSKGFSLVETLVAVSILSLSVAATFTVVQTALRQSIGAKDQITAFYLAQEAIEFIKSFRDKNAIDSINGGTRTWLTDMSSLPSDPCYFGNVCVVDPAHPSTQPLSFISCGTAPITSSPPNVCNPLNGDPVTGLFGYTSTWPATRFKREVQFESISANEVNIIIFISWTDRGAAKFFRVSESLFNRQ